MRRSRDTHPTLVYVEKEVERLTRETRTGSSWTGPSVRTREVTWADAGGGRGGGTGAGRLRTSRGHEVIGAKTCGASLRGGHLSTRGDTKVGSLRSRHDRREVTDLRSWYEEGTHRGRFGASDVPDLTSLHSRGPDLGSRVRVPQSSLPREAPTRPLRRVRRGGRGTKRRQKLQGTGHLRSRET